MHVAERSAILKRLEKWRYIGSRFVASVHQSESEPCAMSQLYNSQRNLTVRKLIDGLRAQVWLITWRRIRFSREIGSIVANTQNKHQY